VRFRQNLPPERGERTNVLSSTPLAGRSSAVRKPQAVISIYVFPFAPAETYAVISASSITFCTSLWENCAPSLAIAAALRNCQRS